MINITLLLVILSMMIAKSASHSLNSFHSFNALSTSASSAITSYINDIIKTSDVHIVSKRAPHFGRMLRIKAGQLRESSVYTQENMKMPTDIDESRSRIVYTHHVSTKDTFMISVLVWAKKCIYVQMFIASTNGLKWYTYFTIIGS